MNEVMAPSQPGADVPPTQAPARAGMDRAVEHWLLSAASDRRTALREWSTTGIAMVRCGGIFAALRVPADIIHAAAGTDDPAGIDCYLSNALRGPVLVDRFARRYYALVPSSTARCPELSAALGPGVECLGTNSFLGVPHPTRPHPGATPSYWCVPAKVPGPLCSPGAIVKVVNRGRRLLEEALDE
ncbi:hypothetical protein DY218_18630 [Streptomyces triticagri]|uniref:DNA primase/polymerase bifunctional N-terminal domain-containing protein n=1 Tax=Streptomyces triticagri TaxID=2293568 RepID=A0A372M4F0_9ACTN|nr:hypothetical protein [Streptomyces triticagri]RFU85177.1 hypothetical protein DY218_18630 [Streptomyces triticagri]